MGEVDRVVVDLVVVVVVPEEDIVVALKKEKIKLKFINFISYFKLDD